MSQINITVEADLAYENSVELLRFIKKVNDNNCQLVVKLVEGPAAKWPVINIKGDSETVLKLMKEGWDTEEGDGWNIIK